MRSSTHSFSVLFRYFLIYQIQTQPIYLFLLSSKFPPNRGDFCFFLKLCIFNIYVLKGFAWREIFVGVDD